MNRIGVMQGRLSPQINGKIQAFPWEHWRSEFPIAKEENFELIEWVFDPPWHEENPLWTKEGLAEILQLSSKHKIEVESVCADYFMAHPFFRGDKSEKAASSRVLESLIERCAEAGARLLEIPMVDSSRLRTEREKNEVVSILKGVASLAEGRGIILTLETDLPPQDFKTLLEKCPACVKANFDMGNSASLGYDPIDEITTLGPWIANVHVKDRVLGGSTVPLGEGNADFYKVFDALNRIGYQGSFILQTARDRDGRGVARRYRQIVLDWLNQTRERAAVHG